MNIQSTYWREEHEVVNLGDYLTEIILRGLGHQFVSYGSGQPFDNEGTLLAVGSILDDFHIGHIKGPKVVWGSGSKGKPISKDMMDFRAVRGPRTRDLLGLPKDIPLGDPAVLLPAILRKGKSNGKTLYIPHCSLRDGLSKHAARALGADESIDITCQRQSAIDLIRYISGAAFVATNSLHAAIIAQSYGVPWALCIPDGVKMACHFKWEDWFAYLGIKGSATKDVNQGKKWWKDVGHLGKIPSVQPLIDAFPYLQKESQQPITA